jgi:nanoRNase/pAp phosphatase (c-di-AMP/oligoRNAs hydrolase)
MSLRSKGIIEVLDVAETMGGGGHLYSSGAFLKGNYEILKKKVVTALQDKIKSQTKNTTRFAANE